ncbi:hypothetical protein GCM10023231_32120 [Olivibacter ginsenosidimutans]|uniref:Uncharacterized protein n=1 Tax=Olivibacter ginsenosidimutans TaxID=1176537 RepID=A0ABP9BW29_9SPHI
MKEEQENPIDINALLETALRREPDTSLPYGFARTVARKAFAQRARFIGYIKSLGIGVCLGVVMLMVLYLFTPTFGKQIMGLLFHWKYTVIFIVSVVTIIQYFDYKLKIVHRWDE